MRRLFRARTSRPRVVLKETITATTWERSALVIAVDCVWFWTSAVLAEATAELGRQMKTLACVPWPAQRRRV